MLRSRHAGWQGALLCVVLGLGLWSSRLGDGLAFWSYDLPFLFQGQQIIGNPVLVYLDEKTFLELGQRPGDFDRAEHVKVLNHLTGDGARLVVYDLWLGDRPSGSTSTADQHLAQALRDHGSVVLAAILDRGHRPGLSGRTLRLPDRLFAEAAAAWGVAEVTRGPGSRVRSYYQGTPEEPSLPEAAARLWGSNRPGEAEAMGRSEWLNYYGPHQNFSSVSFSEVTQQTKGFFTGKAVFVGAYPKTPYAFDEVDEFETPYSRWGGGTYPGVALAATAYLNEIRGDGITRLGRGIELGLLLGTGLLFGFGLTRLPPWQAGLVGGLGLGFLATAGVTLLVRNHVWFAWTVMGLVQIPAAWANSLAAHYRRQMERKRGIPDHTLLTCVGRGAYGEVWLARNEVGAYHAVKMVRRQSFDREAPYEREFLGLKNFMPISRSHPGFVNILHVGRDDAEGYFFSIMEAADDAVTGATIDPGAYVPQTLARIMEEKGRMSPESCQEMMLHLADALEHLHRHGLIHRDIKPANIIFVRGLAKFADIGLVTEAAGPGRDVTSVGTWGYMAPEGPGTPASDVYSLGKVFYGMLTGLDAELFPELPTGLMEGLSEGRVAALNRVVGKACEHDVQRRFQSAAELRAALEAAWAPDSGNIH